MENLGFIEDNKERKALLEDLFQGQEGSEKRKDIIYIWQKCRIPTEKEIKKFYNIYYK